MQAWDLIFRPELISHLHQLLGFGELKWTNAFNLYGINTFDLTFGMTFLLGGQSSPVKGSRVPQK